MAIKVKHEDVEELKKWGMGLERIQELCLFCKQQTRFWAVKSNNPVCQPCALTHDDKDLKAVGGAA